MDASASTSSDKSTNKLSSRLLVPYKAIGLICSRDVPISLRAVGGGDSRDPVIFAACGAVVHQYNAHTLRLISVSDSLEGPITVIASDNRRTFAAYADKLVVFTHNRKVGCILSDVHRAPITHILPFGGSHCVTIDVLSHLVIWDVEDRSMYAEMQMQSESFRVTAVCHPLTYLNKIVLGSKQGRLRIVNIKSCRVIHEFVGWDSAVTCLTQTPAQDVLAVGLEDGRCVLHNLVYDETVMTFKQQWGAVQQIAFRTDGPSQMITASQDVGHLAVWDLEERRFVGQISEAHQQGVNTLVALENKPLIITSGRDNAIRVWVFDKEDGLARELVEREGPSMPVSCVRFHGADGEMVLASSMDGSVRAFSTWKDTKQTNLGVAGTMRRSQAKRKKIDFSDIKLPPVLRVVSNTTRESVWDNIVCVHENSPIVSTWTSRRNRLGSHRLCHSRFESTPSLRRAFATDAVLSACGNFALISYSSGHVDVYNVQSGQHRGSFVDAACSTDLLNDLAHSTSINAIVIDSFNRTAITADQNGLLKYWRFKTRKLINHVQLEASVQRMCMHTDNNLLAVVMAANETSDTTSASGQYANTLLVADVQFGRVLRRFPRVHARASHIYDVQFNQIGDCLYTSGSDSLVKIWHLTTASLVDVIRFDAPCVSISASPTGEYIATCHRDKRGVYLWANRLLYEPNLALTPLPMDYEPSTSLLPNSAAVSAGTTVIDIDDDNEPNSSSTEVLETSELAKEIEQISQLATLSDQPVARWAQLLDLDVIRERNRPKEPPKKPKKAPFFLPTTATAEGFTFDATTDQSNDVSSRIMQNTRAFAEPQTKFGVELESASSVDARRQCFMQLTQMSPSEIDSEFRQLNVFVSEDEKPTKVDPCFMNLLRLIDEQLSRADHFELTHSYLACILKLHRTDLWRCDDADVTQLLTKIQNTVVESWKRLETDIGYDHSVVQWLRSAVV